MQVKTIFELISALKGTLRQMDEELTANEGEVTEEVEALEFQYQDICDQLTGEGVDTLGRWLASVEDDIARVKAEEQFLAKRKKSLESKYDYIKHILRAVLDSCEVSEVRGDHGYKIKVRESVTTTTDSVLINELYGEKAEKALKDAGIPSYITFKLGASVKRVEEGQELPEVFIRNQESVIQFTKPKVK